MISLHNSTNAAQQAVQQLDNRHRQEWLQSAVSQEIISLNVWTIDDARDVDQLLNRNTGRRWTHSDHLVPGWAVAGVDPQTGERCYRGAQFKPDNPPPCLDDHGNVKPGKFRKYLAASGETSEPLFLDNGVTGYWQGVLKNNAPIHIAEGAKKAGCLLTGNLAAISIAGCWNWQTGGKLNSQIAKFCTKGRAVYLWPDSDWQDNPQVAAGWRKLAQLIQRRGCDVRVCTWDSGKGIDDHIAAGGNLAQVMGDALPLKEWLAQVKENLDELRAGLPRLSQDKVLMVLEKELGAHLRFNELTQSVELNGAPVDVDTAYLALSQQVGALIGKEICADALLFLAQRRKYNPVVDYLEKVSQDAIPIPIDDLASRYFGTTNPLYNTFIKKFLIGAVARAYQPGCKVDTALILQGQQGQGKSSFFAALGGAWFDDSLGPLDGKDDVMTLHRSWIQEWSEFDHVSGHRQASQIKAFLSRRIDRFRPPYGRCVKEFPRRGVICGSTNQQEFLNDPTGSRRFWIIPTGSRPIDVATLQRERDSIWAAAVQAYKDGAQWWLTPAEHDQSETLNLEYQQSDPWQEIIQGKLSLPGALSQMTTEYILTEWLGLPVDRHGKVEQRRVGAIMRQLGWENSTQRINGTPKKCWVKVCPDIGNISNAIPESPTTTALEGVTDIGNSVTDPKPIGNTSVTDAPPIGNAVTDIGNRLKAPPQANSGTPVTDVTDAPAQLTPDDFYRHDRGNRPPGDGWLWLEDDSLPGGGEWLHDSELGYLPLEE
jgi:predicted P-loop ATPase